MKPVHVPTITHPRETIFSLGKIYQKKLHNGRREEENEKG
jgi:hypothetical protein